MWSVRKRKRWRELTLAPQALMEIQQRSAPARGPVGAQPRCALLGSRITIPTGQSTKGVPSYRAAAY